LPSPRWTPLRALASVVLVLLVLAGQAPSWLDAGSRVEVGSTAPTPRAAASDLKPKIDWKRIPYGAKRRRQMAGYSKRHYGHRTWHLNDPNVIVEHYTDGNSFSSAWYTFAQNTKHDGEYPGVCAHFIIDTDGTIYQLVDTSIRCRHTIGLNWTAIGIEHVGTSDRQILRNRRMMNASLQLTLWLMAKYGIQVRNVIGHSESLRSPYHKELYPSWRCLTHSDWSHRHMRIYRRRLKRLARANGVPVGPKPAWGHSNC
jgi:N-acetylmuramoyl-L-alanine amidase-like protein